MKKKGIVMSTDRRNRYNIEKLTKARDERRKKVIFINSFMWQMQQLLRNIFYNIEQLGSFERKVLKVRFFCFIIYILSLYDEVLEKRTEKGEKLRKK